MRKLLPLNPEDLVEVKEGFVKDKIGTVIENDSENSDTETYKLSFDNGWVGWHQRSNLRVIKRRSPCTN